MAKALPVSRSESPIRLLFVDHTARFGGGEIALLNLILQLDPCRFEAKVILLAHGPLAERLATAGYAVQVLPLDPSVGEARKDRLGLVSIFRLRAALKAILLLYRLRRAIRVFAPAIVHTNSLKSDILGGLAARLAGVPVIWHVRDRISADYLPPSIAKLFRHLCRWVPNLIIANSEATLDSLGDAVRCKGVVVHDGTEVPETITAQRSSPERAVVGLIGRLAPWKGQHVFLDSAANVLRHFPETRFRLIGAAMFGEEAYEVELRRQVERLGIQHGVEFRGFCDDVQNQIQQLDVAVHASVTAEPFGQVVIEAMAAGRPVVATAAGGPLEIVEHGVTGLLVPMDDARALGNAICELLADPVRAKLMGQMGRQRVRDRFTIQRTAAAVQKIYHELLSSRSCLRHS